MNKIEEILKRFDEGFRNQGDWYADSILKAEALDKYKQFLLTAIKEVLEELLNDFSSRTEKIPPSNLIDEMLCWVGDLEDLISQIDKELNK